MRIGVVSLVVLSFFTEGRSFDNERLDAEWDVYGKEVNVTIRLYTKKNIKDGVNLVLGDKNRLAASGFKGSLKTIVITHGYNADGGSPWLSAIKKEVLAEEEANVITFDWSGCSKNLLYDQVVKCMKDHADHSGKFFKFLQDFGKMNLDKVHLIGHSLGAHYMGLAVKVFPERSIGRITALDPASPLFENAEESDRLNPRSAKLVDVIHTCRVVLGMKKPIGTVDFYPNGGFNQPGCDKVNLQCNHSKSHEYFVKTFSKTKYVAKKCNGLDDAINEKCNGAQAVMGYRLEYRSPGIYHLKMN